MACGNRGVEAAYKGTGADSRGRFLVGYCFGGIRRRSREASALAIVFFSSRGFPASCRQVSCRTEKERAGAMCGSGEVVFVRRRSILPGRTRNAELRQRLYRAQLGGFERTCDSSLLTCAVLDRGACHAVQVRRKRPRLTSVATPPLEDDVGWGCLRITSSSTHSHSLRYGDKGLVSRTP